MNDPLTGLLSKDGFYELAGKALKNKEFSEPYCVYLDVNRFKLFYARNGFDVGFRCLRSIGEMIHLAFEGEREYICRSTNDCFIVLTEKQGVEDRVKEVQYQITKEWDHTGLELTAGFYEPREGDDIKKVASRAKMAAKNAQKTGDIEGSYDGEIERSIGIRQHIIHHFDEAIEKRWIRVYYQPIIHVVNGRLCGYEALARWDDPKYGLLLPGDFVPVLEEAKQIHRMDSYVIRQVCRDMRLFKEKGRVVVPVSVNLSKLDFHLTDMVYIIQHSIEENGIIKEDLHIEIAEALMKDEGRNIKADIQLLKDAGLHISMDDFGSRYSSLHILKDMPFDALKIDSQFVEDFGSSVKSRIILKNVLNMAKELGIQTMMEGVEQDDVFEFLTQIGCEKSQGILHGEPLPLERLSHEAMKPETDLERDYSDAIGKVNLLSQMPMETGWSHVQDDAALLNVLPLAIIEFNGRDFDFLMTNKHFDDIFKPLGIDGKDDPQSVFNNPKLTFANQVHSLAEQCIMSGNERAQDFVTSDGFHQITLRCISYNVETDTGALLAIVERMSEDDPRERNEKMESALRFLYTQYSRVDLLNLDEMLIDNVYLNASKYSETFIKGSFERARENFAERNIYREDREKFMAFLDMSTLDERMEEIGGDHVIDYMRTTDSRGNYTWQMYMLIPIVAEGKRQVLICSRGIDAERMRRLPEISREGAEYYDMPGNPVFLLLASRAFTSTLGYGSFDQFLRNSFFVEASLKHNSLQSVHLGKEQKSEGGKSGSESFRNLSYDQMICDFMLDPAVEDDRNKVREFYDRERLLSDYEKGKTAGDGEFLRMPGDDGEQPRYMHTCYQVRESADGEDINIYMLTFDIDDYRRADETIHRLAERDTLTGLFNRSTAIPMIRDHLKKVGGSEKTALVILDLDEFKQINDRYGHDCGDSILKDASERMCAAMEKHGLVARIGGDEFLAMLTGLKEHRIEALLRDFSGQKKTVKYKDSQITYTMSIGYAMAPEHGDDHHTLYQNADLALYTVKMGGRNGVKCYVPDMAMANRDHLGFNVKNLAEGVPGGLLVYRANESMDILYANKRLISLYECRNMEDFRRHTKNSFKGCVLEDDWDLVDKTIGEQVETEELGYDYVQYRAKTAKGNIITIEDYGRLMHSDDDGDLFYVFMLNLGAKNKAYGEIMEAMREKMEPTPDLVPPGSKKAKGSKRTKGSKKT